jgi:hypothetical protein
LIRNFARAAAVIGAIGVAGSAPPLAPLVFAVATPVGLVDYRASRPPKQRRRRPPITAATPRRNPPAALRSRR